MRIVKNELSYAKIIGKNIRRQREKRSIAQADLAKLLGMSTPAVCQMECGTTNIRVSRLKQISDVLNVSLQELIYDEKGYGINEVSLNELNRLKRLLLEKEMQINQLRARLIPLYELVVKRAPSGENGRVTTK